MKKKLLLPIIAVIFLLTACGQTANSTAIAPFTEVVWGSSLNEICELEGDAYTESLSMAGGYNYIYPKQYLDYDGYVQYNIDDEGALSSVSWFYIGNDETLASDIYNAIHEKNTTTLGEEKPLDVSNVYSGNKWETSDSNVMLISFSQEGEYAVQISYLIKE